MAKIRATGFVVDGNRLEWTLLVPGGRAEQGVEILPVENDDLDAESAHAAAVEQVRTVCGAIKGDTALGLPSVEVLLRVVELPVVDDSELADMVELQVDKFAPFPIETMAVSHQILDRGETNCRVLIAAVRNEAVDRHAEWLMAAGMKPSVIDSCALGWWRLLQDSGTVPLTGRAALLVLNGSIAELMIVQEGIPLVFRSLELDSEAGENEVAGEILRELSHTLMTVELEHGAVPCDCLLWTSEERSTALNSALNREQFGSVTSFRLDELPPVCEGIARRLASGNGINLTPQVWLDAEAAVRRRRQTLQWLGVVLGAWLLCVLILASLFTWRKASIRRLQARRQKWEAPAMQVRELRARVLMIDRYTDMSHSALECLREISGLQPEGVDLTSFAYTKGDALRLVGKAQRRGMIYDFKEELDGSGLFPQVELGTQVQDRKRRDWSFDMDLELPGGEDEL